MVLADGCATTIFLLWILVPDYSKFFYILKNKVTGKAYIL